MKTILALSLIWAAGPSNVMPDWATLINKALDETTRITLENITLADAIAEISRQTGVPLVMAPEAMALTPRGGETVIERVLIENVSLRRGLTELFGPLGMTFEVRGDLVAIVPKAALACLGRPPTWEDLATLDFLAALHPGESDAELEALRSKIQFQVPARDPWGSFAEAVRGAGAGPGDEVLTIACENLGWSWCPAREKIAVTSAEQQILRRLRQVISLRVQNRPLFDVLDEVGRLIQVPIRIEAGIPAPKSYSINASNAAAERVLDKIASETGLSYLVEPGGVLFYNPLSAATGSPPLTAPSEGSAADPWICKIVITLDGTRSIEFPLRESEFPDDLRQLREQYKAEFFETLRSHAAQRQLVPADNQR
jgi:hypothetical protein